MHSTDHDQLMVFRFLVRLYRGARGIAPATDIHRGEVELLSVEPSGQTDFEVRNFRTLDDLPDQIRNAMSKASDSEGSLQ